MQPKIADLDRNFRPLEVADGLTWYDARDLPVEGRGWTDPAAFYQRLPARARGLVRDAVWSLSQHTAGLAIRFVTDARVITVRWELTSADLAMAHMPASGMSGVDLYGYHDGAWRWAGCGHPQGKQTTAAMGGALLPGKREYLLYLPLYNGIVALAIGLPEGALIEAAAPRAGGGAGFNPVVVYGTSIVQGGCAARAGMGYPEIMARWLDRPSINLGFSGNGPMDLELAPLLGEIEAAAYVIDALPNMSPEMVRDRATMFLTTLREARPATPIVVVENITYQRAWLQAPGSVGHERKNTLLHDALQTLRERGLTGIQRVPGADLLGTDGMGTVDGTHPTDLGFWRMAQAITPVLRPLI